MVKDMNIHTINRVYNNKASLVDYTMSILRGCDDLLRYSYDNNEKGQKISTNMTNGVYSPPYRLSNLLFQIQPGTLLFLTKNS